MVYQRMPDYQPLGQYHCEHFNVLRFRAAGPMYDFSESGVH